MRFFKDNSSVLFKILTLYSFLFVMFLPTCVCICSVNTVIVLYFSVPYCPLSMCRICHFCFVTVAWALFLTVFPGCFIYRWIKSQCKVDTLDKSIQNCEILTVNGGPWKRQTVNLVCEIEISPWGGPPAAFGKAGIGFLSFLNSFLRRSWIREIIWFVNSWIEPSLPGWASSSLLSLTKLLIVWSHTFPKKMYLKSM